MDDRKFINDNTAAFSKKIESQYSIFLDKSPTFVSYFHINYTESTTDTGLLNVEKLTGTPATKYNLIKEFPIYGIEQIVLDLIDEEKGFDSEYEGTGTILPGTIKPMADDYFVIDVAGKKFCFRVTKFSYDTIRSNNFYNIEFTIKAADDPSYYDTLMAQVKSTSITVFRNYGTEDKFIIEETDFATAKEVDELYDKIADRYLLTFYNPEYNAVMLESPVSMNQIYDVFVNTFCNKEKLFARDDQNFYNKKFYEESRADFNYLYKAASIQEVVVDKDLGIVRSDELCRYFDEVATFEDSIFKYYGDYSVKGVTMYPTDVNPYGALLQPVVSDAFVNALLKEEPDGMNMIYDIISSFISKDIGYVGKLIIAMDKRPRIKRTYEDYTIYPILMFVMVQYYKHLIGKQEQ